MRAVVQRVKCASVEVDGEVVSRIGPGLLCLIGVGDGDGEAQAEWMCRRLLGIRLWQNQETNKAWDHSLVQKDYEILCVSQFTLMGRLKGNKPDYSKAMAPAAARELYSRFLERLRREYRPERVQDGVFGAMMSVKLENDGPVTFVLDSAAPNGASMSSMSSLDD